MIYECDFDALNHLYGKKGSTILAPSVTQCLKSVGMYANLDDARAGVVERKKLIGSEADRLVAMIERGQMEWRANIEISRDYYVDPEDGGEFEIDPRVRPYLDSYMEFKVKADWKVSLVKYGPFISDNIFGMLCGFELDLLGTLAGEESVADVKCTAEDEPHHGVQIAGYDLCLGGGPGPDAAKTAPRRKRFTIRLQADGRMAKLKHYNEEADYRIFQSALSVTWWKINKGMLDLRKP